MPSSPLLYSSFPLPPLILSALLFHFLSSSCLYPLLIPIPVFLLPLLCPWDLPRTCCQVSTFPLPVPWSLPFLPIACFFTTSLPHYCASISLF
jgi:hypothetical protein